MKIHRLMLVVLLATGISISLKAQTTYDEFTDSIYAPPGSEAEATAEAKNGWFLPTSGMLRVLVVFVELDYDLTPGNDPFPNGGSDWSKGQLPNYKDDLFDSEWPVGTLQGSVTRYFAKASYDNFKVLGDYVDNLIVVKESDLSFVSKSNVIREAITQINQQGALSTNAGMTITDFDNWQDNGIAGSPKIAGPDTPNSYDQVFFILQNVHVQPNTGSTRAGTLPLALLGYGADTWSEGNIIKNPTRMITHELGHLLFGDNTFHNGGAHTGSGTGKTFIPPQGGWSLIGGSQTSIATFNAWDRDRMEWKNPSKTYLNSALDENLNEVETALDATNSNHAGIYILRDFVTTGDVIRIKLPFIPTNEFQQYLWIENHQTAQNNGFEFDKFLYQDNTCMDEMQPGLYMYMQAGKDIKVGTQTYDQQKGHYTRPIPANGMYDLQFESTTQPVTCVAYGAVEPYEKLPQFANPLTGNQEQELHAADLNANNFIQNEVKLTWLERVNGIINPNLTNNGTVNHVFTKNGVAKLGVGTNPSANSMITLENDGGPIGSGNQNNRKVILNGISIEILDELQDGSIKVEVKFDDTDIANDVRWCGDIELPAITGANGYSLNLTQGNTLLLDQGFTATKITNPMSIGGTNYFVDPTVLSLQSGSYFHLEQNSDLFITGNSTLILKSGSKLELEDGAELFIHEGELIIEDGAELILHDGAKLIVDTDGKLTINNTITGKGLIVGDNTVTSNQAEVIINGTLTFASNAIWVHKKSGFYNFASTHTLNLPSTVDVTFTGLLISHKMLELQNSCQLTFSGNTINWSKGLIHYGLSAQVNLTNADFSGTVLTFTGPTSSQPGSIGLNVVTPTKMHLFNSTIEKLQTGVKISNATVTGMFLGNTYIDNVISIDLDSTASTTIAQSHFSTSNPGGIGIKAVESFQVNITATTIIGLDKGAYFYSVDAAYINNNSNISYASIGIEAENTLLFVRGQSEIHQNTKGVAIFGNYNYSTNNYSSMLTIGDVGCGAIYDNAIGVYGRDAILNIDAIEHSINSSGSDTIPNRFDNNSTYTFDICYTDYTVAPSQINAKMNYWGGTVIPTSNYRLKTNTDCIAKPNHGINIPLITSPHSTCTPTPNCANCAMTGGGGTSPGGPIGGIGLMVVNAFQTANEPFIEEDNLSTREGFTDISSVGLLKDTTNQTWQAVTINNDLLSIDKNSVHRIQVAKAIKAKATTSNMRLATTPNDIFAGITENANELANIQVYPNPVNIELTISIEDIKGIYMLNIYQISGKLIIEEKLNSSLSNIDVSSLENGIYFYEIISESGDRLTGKVSVVR